MPYPKTTWVDGSVPAIDAANLNNIETGISKAPYGPDAAAAGQVPVSDGAGGWTYEVVPGTLTYRKTSTVDVVSSNASTDMLGLSIAASAIGTNGIVLIKAWGDYLNNTGSNQTISITPLFGGSFVNGAANFTVVSSAARGAWRLDWWLDNQNAANAQKHYAQLALAIGSGYQVLTATAVDTTGAVALALKAQNGIADANLSTRMHGALIQVLSG